MNAEINKFLRLSGQRLAQHGSQIGCLLETAMSESFRNASNFQPTQVPACQMLNRLSGINADSLLLCLLDCSDKLHWRLPGFGSLPRQLQHKMAVAELLGPQGMFLSENLRFGVLLQAEGTVYPPHSHRAEELYQVLHGHAHWQVGNKKATIKPPGSFVYHPSGQPHSMVNGSEPLVALWIWAGDIDGRSYTLSQASTASVESMPDY